MLFKYLNISRSFNQYLNYTMICINIWQWLAYPSLILLYIFSSYAQIRIGRVYAGQYYNPPFIILNQSSFICIAYFYIDIVSEWVNWIFRKL